MVQLENISKSFGERTLFDKISWRLLPGRRIGLVGANGAGKSTLFRILLGELEPDGGRVVVPSKTRIGLLPQDVGELGDVPLTEFVLEGRAELMEMERAIAQLTERIDAHTDSPEKLEALTFELAESQERFRILGGYEFRARAEEILRGIGFRPDQLQDSATTLSGGWKMRLVLARLLLQRPDVLLMDEPTNHLDLPSVEWLEGFLGNYDGTVVVISHDRYFLNRLVNQTASLEPDGLHVFEGTYDQYLVARAERIDLLMRQRGQQEKTIKETQRFIERFRSKATKAKQVQSRVKQLEKMDRIEIPDERKALKGFRFAEAVRPGKVVATLEGVGKAYGDNVVYEGLDLEFPRGEKVVLVGPNGAGKSTLLKLIMHRIEPTSGTIELGHNVEPAYFAQHQVDELELDRTLLEEMEADAPFDQVPRCRSLLGAFLFTGDDVQKKVRVLSGGEKNRLALAKMLLHPSNVLLLDEPTNHLDMVARDVLTEAMRAYSGTIIFVSHDRHFINAIATRVLHVEDGQVIDYPGDYEYYRYKRAQEAELADEDTESAPDAEPVQPSAPKLGRKERKRLEAQFRQEVKQKVGKTQKKLAEVESKVASSESELEEIEAKLADPATYESGGDDVSALTQRQRQLQEDLAYLYDDWATLSEEIEDAEARIRARLGLPDTDDE